LSELITSCVAAAGFSVCRYLQYDDWFYPVSGPTYYGATVTWDAKPSVFPHGLR